MNKRQLVLEGKKPIYPKNSVLGEKYWLRKHSLFLVATAACDKDGN